MTKYEYRKAVIIDLKEALKDQLDMSLTESARRNASDTVYSIMTAGASAYYDLFYETTPLSEYHKKLIYG